MNQLEKFVESLATATIADVRKAAATYRVSWSRDMSKEEIIEAIKASLSAGKYALQAVGDVPQPGWVRIRIHSDPSPTASNRPVYVSVNGYATLIPRDINVDVPAKTAEVLANSKSAKLKEDTSQPMNSPGRYRFVEQQNYPFSIISYTPGPDPRDEYEKSAQAAERPREAFKNKYGYWPKTEEELRDAIRSGDLTISQVREV